jgi:hypothetical protein
VFLWGIPASAKQVELFYWHALSTDLLDAPVNAPPGYSRALMLNLAIEVSASFGIVPPATLVANARDALGDIKELNAPDMFMVPDPGMPAMGRGYVTRAQFESGNV